LLKNPLGLLGNYLFLYGGFCFGDGPRSIYKIVIPAQLVSKDLIGAEGKLNSEQGGNMKQKIFLCFLIAAGVLMLSVTDGYSFSSGDPGCGTVIECGNCHVAGGPGAGAGIFTFCEACPDDPSCTTPTTLPPTTTTLPPTPTTTMPSTPTTTLAPTTTTTLAPTTTTTTLPSEDLCPDDPNKTEPGICGCGRTDVDSDSDGLEDCIDNAPYNPNPDQTDSDGDGVGDVAETDDTVNDPSVASLLVNYGQDRVTVSTDVNNSLEDVYTLATDQVGDLPSGVTFPFDLFGFAVTGFGAGNPTTVTINLPDGEEPTTYWKYGPTPLDGTDHWYEFLYDGTTGAELDGNVITLHFVDGERGDHDLTADGIIDDPGGPAFVSTGGGSSSSTCFIATAAYGTSWEPHVMTLRQFRDSYLLTNKLGTKFVETYYKYSPPMANYIAQHRGLRSAVRVGLAPLVGFSWLAMNYGMMFALTMLFSMLTIIIGVAFFIVRIREAN
jgi:hypothetical protein